MAGMQAGAGDGFKGEPNVVPMIDILLVLLIIFMMQVNLSRKTMKVNVPPEVQQQQQQNRARSDQIVLIMDENGGYAINGQSVPFSGLDAKFHEVYDNRPAKILFLKVARNRKYQDIMDAMDVARNAGVQVIGFTPPSDDNGG